MKMTETAKIQVKTSNANGMEEDKEWLTFVRNEALNAQNAQYISWAAFHATHTERSPICVGLPALLPMWRESSKSSAIIKHFMMVIAKATEFLNPFSILYMQLVSNFNRILPISVGRNVLL